MTEIMELKRPIPEFPYPRSLVGRALMLMFAAPLAYFVFSYLLHIGMTGYGLFVKYDTGGVFPMQDENPAWIQAGLELIEYGKWFVIRFFNSITVYISTLMELAVAWLLIYLVSRFVSGGEFGGRKYFKISVAAAALRYLIAPVIGAYNLAYNFPSDLYQPTDTFGGELLSLCWLIFVCLCNIAIITSLAYWLFVKTPFRGSVAWKSEMPSESFSKRLRTYVSWHAHKLGRKKIVAIFAAGFAFDFIYYQMQWFLCR